MSKGSIEAMLVAAVLSVAVLPAVQAKAPAGESTKESTTEPASEKQQAELEAKLKAARERLEAAAREVGELSAQVYGSMSRDFLMPRLMHGHAMIGIGIGGPGESKGGKGESDKQAGVYVESVTPGGPAADAGIKTGDVLVSIDGKDLKKATPSPNAALIRQLRRTKAGEKVKVEYLRAGKTRTAEITTEAADFSRFAYGGKPGSRMFRTHPVPPGAGVMPAAPMMHPFAMFQGGVSDMELVTLTPKLGSYFGAERGVLVVRAPRDSSLKLEEGDVLIDIDGREPQSGAHAMRILRSYQPGEKLTFNVLRNKKKMALQVTVPKDEAFGKRWGRFEYDPAAEAPAIPPAPEPFEAPVPPPPPASEVM